MNILLFDETDRWQSLQPITFTRPIGAIRIGILTITEKWKIYLKPKNISSHTASYLQEKYNSSITSDTIIINSSILPDKKLITYIKKLKPGNCLVKDKDIIALSCTKEEAKKICNQKKLTTFTDQIQYPHPISKIEQLCDLFTINGNEIRKDFELLTKNKKSKKIIDKHTIVYNAKNIFVEENVHIRAAILNAESGPIFIGKNAHIQEGAIIKGPFSIGEGAYINMGSKMREDTTIGPYCKVGGEISNSIIIGYSNKAHEGFLGNSILGEWCNLGADTNTSNLKNNYSNVKLWNYLTRKTEDTHRQFCGLMMGDHSKSSINTMFNTGTSIGICANIIGGDFPPKFIPSFTWGDSKKREDFKLEKAFESIEKMMQRRGKKLEEADKKILIHLAEATKKDRI